MPVAAYRAALGGFSSLTSTEPGLALPRLALASVFYGMDVMQREVSHGAHSVVYNMNLTGCRNGKCVVNEGVGSPGRRMEGLKKAYDAMVKGDEGDVLSSVLLGNIFCANCATAAGKGYKRLCGTIWENLPRIFRVGKSWEEI